MQFWNALRGGLSATELVVQTKKACEQLIVAVAAKRQGLKRYEWEAQTAETNAGYALVLTETSKLMQQMKHALIGDVESEADEGRCEELAGLVVRLDFVKTLAMVVGALPLEPRKDAAHVFSNLMSRDMNGGFSEAVVNDPVIIETLVTNLDRTPDVAVSSAGMLREAVKNERVADALLKSQTLWRFFTTYVNLPDFDVAADAFEILKVVLISHPTKSAPFIAEHYVEFFGHFNNLLISENYVTCRESVRMLGELLLDRANFNTMMRYIAARENLKVLMSLLRNKKTRIQIEAFHVFKVFVANPKKPVEITRILYNNKDKLVAYLKNFQVDVADEQFDEEKALIIETLSTLEEPPPLEPPLQPTR